MPTLLTELSVGWPASVHGAPVGEAYAGDVRVPAALDTDEYAPADRTRPAAPLAAEDEYTAGRLREMGYI
jgi:hypothetical protein